MGQQNSSFMEQFAAAKREVAELKSIIKESVRVATLSYPQPPTARANEGKPKTRKHGS